MFKSGVFVWNKNYETMLDDVDTQHKYLVDLINVLSEKLLSNSLTYDELEDIFTKLVDYTKFHFSDEELLMAKKGVYEKHIKDHKKNHRKFVHELNIMYSEISKDNFDLQKARDLRDFLLNWLAFHILDEDRTLAKQIFLIEEGIDAKIAYKKTLKRKDKRTQTLVAALKGVLEVLGNRNKALVQLKSSLELKVQERTKELIQANKILKQLSMTDQLTKLANRRYAIKTLRMLWKEHIDINSQLSCLMVDVDNFKEVNDGHGHDAGDIVLQEISLVLKESVRTDDIVCRLGGDEFLIICPYTDKKGSILVALNIHDKINKLVVPLGHKNIYKGSVSIGVANSDNLNSIDELIKQADKCVYKAKKDGKNCVRY